jgi:5-deoxy-D-glucuronate isomerase
VFRSSDTILTFRCTGKKGEQNAGYDFSLSHFREGMSIQLRVDAYNAFNIVSLNAPSRNGATVGSSTFGLLAGFTFSEPGNWTSWRPHEHAKVLEEMYVYFDMPEPAYGLQLVYNDTQYAELVTPVRDRDAVLMPSGYHPNVSVPGHRIAFL